MARSTRWDRLRNRHEWSFAGWALATHIAIWLSVNAGLLLINLLTGVPPFWFLFPLWGWGILIAAHAGYLIYPRGLLGTTIGIYLVLNLGLTAIDFVYSDTRWFYWPLLILGIAVLIHIGAVVTLRLREQEATAVPQSGLVATTPHISDTSRIIMSVLLVLSLVLAAGEFATGAINGISIRGSGHAKTITRSLAPFTAITVRGQGKLFVEIGPSPAITIKGDDNIVGRIEMKISGSTLTIEPKREWYYDIYPKLDLEYHVTVPSLAAIHLYDHAEAALGDVRTGNLELVANDEADLTIKHLTASQLSLRGRDNADVTIQDGGANGTTIEATDNVDINLTELVSWSATITAHDNADVYVHAAHAIDAVAYDNSEIRYTGKPDVKSVREHDNAHISPAGP